MRSSLKEYRTHPPFTADVLILTANDLLAAKSAQLVSKRTLRFYTAQNVVPPPLGSPKFARYGYEHLLSLLAARALQDQGMKLEQIRTEVSEVLRGRYDRIEALVEGWLEAGAPILDRLLKVREIQGTYDANSTLDTYAKLAKQGSPALRIKLSPAMVLEVSDVPRLSFELRKAAREIERIIDNLGEEEKSSASH